MGAFDAYGGRVAADTSSHSFPTAAYTTWAKEKPSSYGDHFVGGGFGFSSVPSASSSQQPHPHYATQADHHHHHRVTGDVPASSSSLSQIGAGKLQRRRSSNETETETETENETENETETDGGWTTDDEPTIRPAHSSAGSGSSEDSRSVCSTSTDNGDERSFDGDDDVGFGDDEKEDGGMDVEDEDQGGDQEGDRTPDRAGRGRDGETTPEGMFERRARRADRDHKMDSP